MKLMIVPVAFVLTPKLMVGVKGKAKIFAEVR